MTTIATLTGDGDYEGLTLILAETQEDWLSYIIPTERMPPVPELPAESTRRATSAVVGATPVCQPRVWELHLACRAWHTRRVHRETSLEALTDLICYLGLLNVLTWSEQPPSRCWHANGHDPPFVVIGLRRSGALANAGLG